MELTTDLVNIQGIFLSLEKRFGSLNAIQYRGGNENTINNAISQLVQFFRTQNYMSDTSINSSYDDELEKIVLFLVLNTEMKIPLDLPEYAHLQNIMPQLSKCLLANLITGLGLSRYYSNVLQKFSTRITEELLFEMIPCLKKCEPKVHIKNSYIFLQLVVDKLMNESQKDLQSSQNLTELAGVLLINLTGLHGDQAINVKINSVYEQIGYNILNLLDLLLKCGPSKTVLPSLVEKLLNTCCTMVMAVTLDVFCFWAEIDHNDQPLQALIAGKAYLFIEEYKKYKAAMQLIEMLSTIARKPKTLNELIQQADIPTMISMINKADSNQKHWFEALLNTQVLKNKDASSCLNNWAHLCSRDDVSRLLNMSVYCNDDKSKKLIVKCASALNLDDLVHVSVLHFHANGINKNLSENVHQQIVLLFNKLKNASEVEEEFAKELHLLILQNPEQVLSFIFTECLKNAFYSRILKPVLPTIEKIGSIGNIGLKILTRDIEINEVTDENLQNYLEFFNILIETKFYSVDVVVLRILMHCLQDSHKNHKYQNIQCLLEILHGIEENFFYNKSTKVMYDLLFDIMGKCRCSFLEFDRQKQEVVKKCVEVILRYCEINKLPPDEDVMEEEDSCPDSFIKFYKNQLFKQSPRIRLLELFYPSDATSDLHNKQVSYLLRPLSTGVTQEWTTINLELLESYNPDVIVEMLVDVMILLSQLVKNQKNVTPQVECMLNGLKYQLENFGITVKNCLQPRVKDVHEEIRNTEHICRLLKELPPSVKREEGVLLANIITESSLKLLKSNKGFLTLVASIKEPLISSMLARKMLEQK